LRLSTFRRAGFRTIRSKEFDSTFEAVAFAGVGDGLASSVLGEGARRAGFQTADRYEMEGYGLLTSLRVEERETKVNVPWEARPLINFSTKKKNYLVADADYYTIGTIENESFDVEAWIRQAVRLVRRHWSAS
jgi:hypothetical protein